MPKDGLIERVLGHLLKAPNAYRSVFVDSAEIQPHDMPRRVQHLKSTRDGNQVGVLEPLIHPHGRNRPLSSFDKQLVDQPIDKAWGWVDGELAAGARFQERGFELVGQHRYAQLGL